jgi:hypothetical protein
MAVREVNFRMGRGRLRERRKAFSRDSLSALCDFLGLPAEEKATFLAETDAIRAATTIGPCVDCGQPLPSPTSDPFRCAACRAAASPSRETSS